MRRALVLALAVPALFVFVAQTSASADHMLFGRYFWQKPGTGDVRLQVRTYQLEWSSPFHDAINEWASRTEFTFSTAGGSNCNIPSSTYYVTICDANYGNTNWGAVADVRTDPSNNHILGGRVRLNTYYQWNYHEARSAWCQEFGHVLGLDHRGTSGTTSDDSDSCMSYHPASPEHPDGHDIAQLACQTIAPGEAKPSAHCTSGGTTSGGSSCILGIICINKAAQHANAHFVGRRDGYLLYRFAIAPPRGAFHLPHQVVW
jgi:hypothetical protein